MTFINDILNIFLPELVILITILLLIIVSMFYNVKFFKVSKWISIVGIGVALWSLTEVQVEPLYFAFSNSIISDTYTVFFKGLILTSTLFIILLTKKVMQHKNHKAFQFQALMLTATLASMCLVTVNDFLTLLVTLETLSVALFFLLAYKKGYLSKEATFKYLITNSFATAVYLFGVSYLYGITGSLNFTVINDYFLQNQPNLLYTISTIFITCGLLFKLAIIPFSNWILDVYDGASTGVVAFISIVPKIAMFGILARLLVFSLSYTFELPFILVILSVITAIWANVLACRQVSLKRILACSSSANAAYMLFALSLVSVYNLSTVLFYLVTYIFMNIGIFAGLIVLENSNYATKITDLKNFAHTSPLFTACFGICLFGLAGLPITSGFVAKLYLFSAIVRSGLIFLPFLIILITTIVVAAFYYIKIVKFMFEKTDEENAVLIRHTSSPLVILYVCSIITILIGIMPSKIIELCQYMAYSI